MKQSLSVLCVSLMTLVVFASAAHAKWSFGIGTGFSLMNVDGKQGFTTVIAGPVKYDVKLDPDDISDLMQSAFGFGGYATDGTREHIFAGCKYHRINENQLRNDRR
jgi:hypothetical protein